MSLNLHALVASVAMAALCGSIAQASDVEQNMQTMQDQILQLQDQLNQQQAEIKNQAAINAAQSVEQERGASSGLSSFFEQVDVNGWVSANWNYNVEGDNGSSDIIGQNSNFATATDSGSFQLDQLWFVFDKAVTKDSRAGFHADIAFGATAENFGDDDDVIELYSAYVSYLAPIGDGIQIDAGKLWTIIGAEVVATTANMNITRGLVWGIQPVNNYGVLATTTSGDLTFKLGFLNDPFSGDLRDTNDNKAVAISVGYAPEDAKWSLTGSLVQGNESDNNNTAGGQELGWSGIADVILTLDLVENLAIIINYDYKWALKGRNQKWNAISVMGRYAINDRTGIAGRYELVDYSTSRHGADDTQHSITLTSDYMLTDDLMVRGEGRWDFSDNDIYAHADGGDGDTQFVILAELVYNF